MRGAGFAGAGAGADKEKVRTHMMFSKSQDVSQVKRKRRGKSKLHLKMATHSADATVQTVDATTDPDEIDPTQWTGNQRVVHFGPMAARDPFFYYYPKGWDIMYPAHFGFFPYRTKKFRGSSPTVCLSAFGSFFGAAGAVMTFLGYFYLYDELPWKDIETDGFNWIFKMQPLQIIGPIFLFIGIICFILGGCWWFCSLNLCSERLRHSKPHTSPPRRTVHQRPLPEVLPAQNFTENSPYVPPPPPPYTILTNAYTEQSIYTPEAEMKLYPPVMAGYSTVSLAQSSTYVGSPYNTLYHGAGSKRGRSGTAIPELSEEWQEYHAAHMKNKFAE